MEEQQKQEQQGPINEAAVRQAVDAVLAEARERTPGAPLAVLIKAISARDIYAEVLPRLNKGKKGQYGQVAGWVKEIRAELASTAAAHTAVVPAELPPLPGPLVEAMAAGEELLSEALNGVANAVRVALDAAITQITSEAQEKIDAAEANKQAGVEEARIEAIDHLRQAETFQAELERVTSERDTLATDLATSREALAKAATETATAHGRIEELDRQVTAGAGKLASLERDLTVATAKAATARGRAEELERQVTASSGKVASLEHELATAKTEAATARGRAEELERQMAADNDKITDLERKLAAKAGEKKPSKPPRQRRKTKEQREIEERNRAASDSKQRQISEILEDKGDNK
jgi:predicted  nucleic acid-binding Zn-ribbon protein